MLIDVSPQDVKAQLDAGEAILVDVRDPSEYEDERVPGAFLMPLNLFNPTQFKTPKNTRVILMCQLGGRSTQAAEKLMASGVAGCDTTYHMTGGLEAWKEAGLEVQVF